MKNWRDKKGGLPAAADPLAGHPPGTLPHLMDRWLRQHTLRGCSQATVSSYRWPLLRFLKWDAARTLGPAEVCLPLPARVRIS